MCHIRARIVGARSIPLPLRSLLQNTIINWGSHTSTLTLEQHICDGRDGDYQCVHNNFHAFPKISYRIYIYFFLEFEGTYFPLNKLTPMMAKISQNTKHTRSTFAMAGMAPIRAFTTTFMPSQRDTARNGRRARKVRKALRALTSIMSVCEAAMEIREIC